MQQKRNMQNGFSASDIADFYDELIEDMLADIGGEALDPRDVMDLSEIVAAVNAERNKHGQALVALPPLLHQQINEYAKQGMYKGKGRKHPRRDSLMKRQFVEAMADMAKERKEELLKSGVYTYPDGTVTTITNKLDASNLAAKETAAAMRAHGLKRKAGTVGREMSKRS